MLVAIIAGETPTPPVLFPLMFPISGATDTCTHRETLSAFTPICKQGPGIVLGKSHQHYRLITGFTTGEVPLLWFTPVSIVPIC
jgi:hypothetical protein